MNPRTQVVMVAGRWLPVLWAAVLTLGAIVSLDFRSAAWSQSPPVAELAVPAQATPSEGAAAEKDSLTTRQDAVALRYQRFETTLMQLAQFLRKTDPDRADLLLRALGKSKETRIPDQLLELTTLLDKGQLGDAIDSQDAVIQQMRLVLLLLQSEDRQSELEKEQQRIQALIRDVDRLIGKQTDARAVTERGGSPGDAAEQQQKVADQTQQVVDKVKEQDAAKNNEKNGEASGSPKPGSKAESKPGEEPSEKGDNASKPGDKAEDKPGDKSESPPPPEDKSADDPASKPDDKKPMEGSQGDASGKPKPSKSGSDSPSQKSPPKDSQSPPQDGSPQPGKPSDDMPPQQGEQSAPQPGSPSEESQEKTPGRDELQRAKEQMERAIEELKQKHRQAASDRQDEALAELLKAKEKLEEILRQLREEEQELLLAALEARFRDMLGRQINVYNGTTGLAAVPDDQRTDRHRSRAVELARGQDEVALLAAKALTLLKEEGSSIAFPEAVVQLRDDMLTSARRLERVDVGELTQVIQKDIIEALEEILDSLQKEMEKKKDQQQQGPQQQQQQQDPALVDALAELKMLRSLQYRVNRRTKQLGRLVDGEQAVETDVVQQLRELSVRQAKIQQTADDLARGRNQ